MFDHDGSLLQSCLFIISHLMKDQDEDEQGAKQKDKGKAKAKAKQKKTRKGITYELLSRVATVKPEIISHGVKLISQLGMEKIKKYLTSEKDSEADVTSSATPRSTLEKQRFTSEDVEMDDKDKGDEEALMSFKK